MDGPQALTHLALLRTCFCADWASFWEEAFLEKADGLNARWNIGKLPEKETPQ
jgi:hypothetical protein